SLAIADLSWGRRILTQELSEHTGPRSARIAGQSSQPGPRAFDPAAAVAEHAIKNLESPLQAAPPWRSQEIAQATWARRALLLGRGQRCCQARGPNLSS